MDQYIGRLLDNRYEILEIIGTGGMAVVYKARCHRLNRLVAIKILKDEFARDEEFRRRFRAEGEAVAMLSNPNIVQVYDVSTTDSANYIVMELIEGISLKQYMEKKGVLNWKETLHFAMQIAKGLEHAHSKGIVHRDIKPHNVMVLKNGAIKVMDFGIARVMSKSNTLTKEALGSVHYISPEQAKGGWVDNRSDLYSLGVVMYEMMTGRPPYDGESPVAVAIQHINGGAVMPSRLNPNIPRAMEQIIMKAMALDVKDRYASAGEMLRDMEEFRKDPMIVFPFGFVSGGDGVPNRPVDLSAPATKPRPAERTARSAGTRGTAGTGNSGRSSTGRRAPSNNDRLTEAQRRRHRRQMEEEEKKSRMTTIAIVSCSVVAVIAIIIFLFALMSGALFKTDLVEVPQLLGEFYYSGLAYDDLSIKVEYSYNEEFPDGIIFAQTPSGGEEVARGTQLKLTVSLGTEPEVKYMENLRGQREEDALGFLRGQGMLPLSYEEYNDEFEAGRVIRTEPAAGSSLTDGQTVKVYVSLGSQVKKAKVPNMVGMDLEDALEQLEALGFRNYMVYYVESSADIKEVIWQSIGKYTEVDVATRIDLRVSEGLSGTTASTTEPPTQPVTQVTTPPTVPETTEAPTDPPEVTKSVTISIPAQEENCQVSLYSGSSMVAGPVEVKAGATSCTVSITASGTKQYQVFIDDVPSGYITVNFDE